MFDVLVVDLKGNAVMGVCFNVGWSFEADLLYWLEAPAGAVVHQVYMGFTGHMPTGTACSANTQLPPGAVVVVGSNELAACWRSM